jgi:hypothetical protein
MTTWRMRLACLIPHATNTHSEYVIVIAFPLEQLHESASMLRYTCIAYLVYIFYRIPWMWDWTITNAVAAQDPTHNNNDSLFFFTNLMHKFFILINLLYSSTCFEHYYAHLQEDNCFSTASGIVTLFRWLFSTQFTKGRSPLVTCILNSHLRRITIPDAVLTQLSSWRWAQ